MLLSVLVCTEGYLLVPDSRSGVLADSRHGISAFAGTVYIGQLPRELAQRVAKEVGSRQYAFIDLTEGNEVRLPGLVLP